MRRLVLLTVFGLVGCELPVAPSLNDPVAVAGTYRQRLPITNTSPRAGAAAYTAPDSATYTLRLADGGGHSVTGTWSITGDPDLPIDPWESVVLGYRPAHEDRLILEYHDPARSRCRMAGTLSARGFVSEQRCEAEQWAVADTFHLFRVDPPPDIDTLVFAPSLGVDLDAMTLLSSGLYIRDLTVGEGDPVGQWQGARFTYESWLHDGIVVDSLAEYPVDRSSPGAFVSPFDGGTYYMVASGQTIAAWDIGLDGMRRGGKRQLVVPPHLGFGEAGSRDGRVPGNAVLVYILELLAVER